MKRLFPLLALAISLPALAHVSLLEPTAKAGSSYRMALKIGHGCGTSPTNTVTVTIPDGIYTAKPMPKAGWKLSTTSAKLDKPYTSHGKTMTEDVRTITWAGGSLPNEFYDEFVISVKLGDEPGKRAIPVTQLCDEGRLDWVEVAKDGEPEPKSPAPVLEVTAADAHKHADHDHMAMDANHQHGNMDTMNADTAKAAPIPAMDGKLEIIQPYARATPPGQKNSAVFLTLHNNDSVAHAVVAASSDVAEKVELHTHTMVDGVMQMRQIPQIELPAQQDVALKPGGLHVMLIGLKQDLAVGSTIQVTLTFDNQAKQTLTVPVQEVQPMQH